MQKRYTVEQNVAVVQNQCSIIARSMFYDIKTKCGLLVLGKPVTEPRIPISD